MRISTYSKSYTLSKDWLQKNQHSTNQILKDLGDLGIFQIKKKKPNILAKLCWRMA